MLKVVTQATKGAVNGDRRIGEKVGGRSQALQRLEMRMWPRNCGSGPDPAIPGSGMCQLGRQDDGELLLTSSSRSVADTSRPDERANREVMEGEELQALPQ